MRCQHFWILILPCATCCFWTDTDGYAARMMVQKCLVVFVSFLDYLQDLGKGRSGYYKCAQPFFNKFVHVVDDSIAAVPYHGVNFLEALPIRRVLRSQASTCALFL